MPAPVATITNLTATGDAIIGPGGITTMVKGLPVACLGDAVAGPMCVSGAITVTTATTKLVKGRPAANLGSMVAGVSPLGVPVSTAVAVCPNVNELV
ncbi:MAG: PAAR domain-containing protein [Treponema sp.]|nr:PAAR domain-containing protein [Treponema sp.]